MTDSAVELQSAILRGDLPYAERILEKYEDDQDIRPLAREVLTISSYFQDNVIHPNEERTVSPNAATVAGEVLLLLASRIHGRRSGGVPAGQYELLEKMAHVADVLMEINEQRNSQRAEQQRRRRRQAAIDARRAEAEASRAVAEAAQVPALLTGLVVSPPSSPVAANTNSTSSLQSPPPPTPPLTLPTPPTPPTPPPPPPPPQPQASSSPAVQSALSAAVREIQNLRRRTIASEARYILQNETCERKMARQAAEHAVSMTSLKRKVQLEVLADRLESQQIARAEQKMAVKDAVNKAVLAAEEALKVAVRTTMCRANEEFEKRLRASLGQAEVRHHKALHEMKTKFQRHMEEMKKVVEKEEKEETVVDKKAVDEENEEEVVEKEEELVPVRDEIDQSADGGEQTLEELAKQILEEDDESVSIEKRGKTKLEKKKLKEEEQKEEEEEGTRKKVSKIKKTKKKKKNEVQLQERSKSAPARFVISCDRDIKNRILLKRRASVGKRVGKGAKPRSRALAVNQGVTRRSTGGVV
jgi:hypothetical protein